MDLRLPCRLAAGAALLLFVGGAAAQEGPGQAPPTSSGSSSPDPGGSAAAAAIPTAGAPTPGSSSATLATPKLQLPGILWPKASLGLLQYAAGVGVSTLTVPSHLLLGQALGSLPTNWVAAVLPGALLFLFVPPAAVALVEWLIGREVAPGQRFHPAFWSGVAVQVAGLLIGALTGVWSGDPTSLGVFTLVDSLVMPAVVTLTMTYTRRPPTTLSASARGVAPRTLLVEAGRREALQPRGTVVVPALSFSF